MLAQLRAAVVIARRPHARSPASSIRCSSPASRRSRSRARPTAASSSRTARSSARALIGQPFDDPKYFWGRLRRRRSNGKALPYNGGASAGSNLGPTNPRSSTR